MGLSTTWNQHVRYFRDHGIVEPHPRAQFNEVLTSFISKTLRKGENIVLGIDMNEDVRTGTLAQQLLSLGLRDLVLSTHSSQSPPATFNSNKTRTPGDAIWGSRAIDILRAGYGPFGAPSPSALSDGHRFLWVEICNQSLLDKHLPTQVPPKYKSVYGQPIREAEKCTIAA